MNIDGSNLTQITRGNHPFYAFNADWSPDGRQILFQTERHNGQGDIYIINSDGTNERPIIVDSSPETLATWSPSGQQIIFNSERDGFRQMYIANIDGSGVQKLEPLSVSSTNFFGIRDWKV
jgi:Tol biopolymer transport system component